MAHNRRVYGQWQNNLPSRFINELPPKNIEIINLQNNYYSNNYSKSNSNSNNNWYSKKKKTTEEVTYDDDNRYSYVSESNPYQKQQASLVGVRVHHETFGYGKIMAADGNKLEIFFDDAGRKKLMSDYVTKV